MQNTTQNVSPADPETEDKEANHRSQYRLRVLRNLNKAKVPYNLHTLQPATMQEKMLIRAVNL